MLGSRLVSATVWPPSASRKMLMISSTLLALLSLRYMTCLLVNGKNIPTAKPVHVYGVMQLLYGVNALCFNKKDSRNISTCRYLIVSGIMRHQVPFSPRRYTLYQELSQSKKDAAPELEAVFANGDMIVVG